MDTLFKDKLNTHDEVMNFLNKVKEQAKPLKTKIIAGYDAYKDKRGITRFGTKVFETENMIVLGGALFILEKVFNVVSDLTVAYLEDFMDGIKRPGEVPITEKYPKETGVCLFGVGIGGCGQAITDVVDVAFYEREITDMVPLRQTADPLSTADQLKYWFKKSVTVDGVAKTAYYLKKFEGDPEIKVLWDDGEGDEDGSEVQSDVYETPASNTTPIETFIEITLKISKDDVREYFTDNGIIEQARINSIGLFTGIKTKVVTNPEEYDYRQVKLFSKFNFNNEMLTMAKDMTIVYRIYAS